MRVYFQIVLFTLYIAASDSSIYSDVAGTLSQYLKASLDTIKSTFQEDDLNASNNLQRNGPKDDINNQPYLGNQPFKSKQPFKSNKPKSNNKPYKGNRPHRSDEPNFGNQPYKSNKPYKGNKPYLGVEPNFGNQPYKSNKPYKNKSLYPGDRPPPEIAVNNDKPIKTQFNKSPKTIIRIFKNGAEFRALDKNDPQNDEQVEDIMSIMPFKSSKESVEKTRDEPYHLDGVLNSIRRQNDALRAHSSSESSDSESSSLELREWKRDWKELWLKKKIMVLNQSNPQGDVVNMVAARPWGVPCGDPNQHDMPWGTCMLAMECEPEYRIYRGDFQCGRTKFICCSLQLTNYDMYQGIDVSFSGSGLSTDSEEQKNRGKGSSEKKRKRKEKEKKRRRKARQKRKKKIKKNIKKIIREIRKILNKQYKNGTSQRKKKTKQLKKFIKDLKKKYRKDRKSVKNVHEIELVKIDNKLLNKIREIRDLNRNFVDNATFREIIINGTINKKGARMLVEAYPELIPYFLDKTRRSGDGDGQERPDYDVEYGMLYY